MVSSWFHAFNRFSVTSVLAHGKARKNITVCLLFPDSFGCKCSYVYFQVTNIKLNLYDLRDYVSIFSLMHLLLK